MPPIKGVVFDDVAYKHVSWLIEQLQAKGDVAVYPLPKMNKPRGEIRFAHHDPIPPHKKARGVFATIRPSLDGATLIRRKKTATGESRTKITSDNVAEILEFISARRSLVKDRLKGFEKAEPNKPGTVSGGQFESKRSKH